MFQVQSFIIIYDYNYSGAPYDQVELNYGDKLGQLPIITRTGYDFKGWFTEKTGGDQVNSETVVEKGIVYYAHWEIKQITITFDANGGTVSEPSYTREYNTEIGPLPTVVNGNFIFAGWFTAKTGGVEVTEKTLVPDTDVIYYARWEETGLNVLKTAKFRGPNASNVAINGSGFTHTKTTDENNSVYLVNDADGNLVSSTSLRFETEIMITNNNIGDAFPKIGIAISSNAAPYNLLEGRFIGYYFYLDLSGTLGQNGYSTYATANKPGTNDGWLNWGDSGADDHRVNAIPGNYAGEYVKFAILKEDGVIKFSLNGTLVQTVNTTDLAGNAYVSILGIGCEYQVKNSVCSQIVNDQDDPMRVLILGNSLVFFNNLPTVFENVARSAGKNISVSSVTRGSATISDYATNQTVHGAKAYDLLLSQKFDYVIVEPSRRIVPKEYDVTTFNAELAAAKVMKQMATDAGAQLLLYAVWGDQDDIITAYDATNPIAMVKGDSITYPRKEHVKFLQVDVSEYFANELGLDKSAIIKAGYAFENHYDSYPSENLYNADQRHPNLSGTYLVACTVFATIYNETPVGVTYSAGLTNISKYQQTAKETVLDGKIPVLETNPADLNVLVVGSGLLNDYNLFGFFPELVEQADNKTVYVGGVLNASFVFNALVEDANDYGLREALASKEWDYIVLQISRRTTPNGNGIEASELAALKAVYPILHAETPNIYLMALNGSANPTKFTTEGGAVGYTKMTDSAGATLKETLTEAQSTDYYTGLATTWSEEINKTNSNYGCKAYYYGACYKQHTSGKNKATVGYLQASSLYMLLFGKTYASSVTCLNSITTIDEVTGVSTTVSMTEDLATELKGIAESVILSSSTPTPDPEPDPTTSDYNVLVVGSGLLNDYNVSTFFPELVSVVDNKTVYYGECLDTSFTFNALKDDATDYGLREMLLEKEWDYIILQITRRVTSSATDVIESELAALKEIYPILHAETPNIYLMAYAAEKTQTIYTTTGGEVSYSVKYDTDGTTALKETDWTTKDVGCEFYATLADTWTAEINKLNSSYKCTSYKYSLVYAQSGGPNKATVGYMIGSSMYMILFGKTYTDTTVLNTVGSTTMTSTQAETLRGYAENICLATA
ncbi:MAG: InlB B-repeat-containing protein [Clostridia bacterium]|nr:InlB B-repeat-containing protein [Clostridia bacterium]